MAGIELCKFTHGLGLYIRILPLVIFQRKSFVISAVVKYGYSSIYRSLLSIFRRYRKNISLITHCRQRAPVENVLSSSGTDHLGMIDIQATTKSKYYDHIVLVYLESRKCCHLSIILYVTVVNFINYSDMDKMMDINNEKC